MPLIVPPTSFKLYEEFAHILDPLWEAAAKKLAEAERVVLIGYSLPATDVRTIDLLRNTVTNRPPARFEVINPYPEEVCLILKRALGLSDSNVYPITKTFSEFVH